MWVITLVVLLITHLQLPMNLQVLCGKELYAERAPVRGKPGKKACLQSAKPLAATPEDRSLPSPTVVVSGMQPVKTEGRAHRATHGCRSGAEAAKVE